jgi:hypothetical protein
MGKLGKERKRRRLLNATTEKVLVEHEEENRVLEFGGLISAEDMATTIRSLNTLKDHPDLIRSKEFKQLRAVMHLANEAAFAVTGKGTYYIIGAKRFHLLISHFTRFNTERKNIRCSYRRSLGRRTNCFS